MGRGAAGWQHVHAAAPVACCTACSIPSLFPTSTSAVSPPLLTMGGELKPCPLGARYVQAVAPALLPVVLSA